MDLSHFSTFCEQINSALFQTIFLKYIYIENTLEGSDKSLLIWNMGWICFLPQIMKITSLSMAEFEQVCVSAL